MKYVRDLFDDKNSSKEPDYAWVDPGDKGRSVEVNISDLKVDDYYQRPKVSEAWMRKTAENFNWVAFGTVIVMQRPNGGLYIVDGQQRTTVAGRLGHRRVPVRIFKSHGRNQEAAAFLDLNRSTSVSHVDKFKAAVAARIDPPHTINKWLKARGLAVGRTAGNPQLIRFPGDLVRSWERDQESTKKAILWQRDIANAGIRQQIKKEINIGMVYLASVGVELDDAHIERIIKAGGITALEQQISVTKAENKRLKTSMSSRDFASSILVVANYRCRQENKLTLPERDGSA